MRLTARTFHVMTGAMLLMAGGCQKQGDAALGVRVTFGSHSKARGVKVVVASATTTQMTDSIPRSGLDTLAVAVYRANGLDGTVTVTARGYLDAECTETLFNEQSPPVTATFVNGAAVPVELLLDGPLEGDADHDGYRAGTTPGFDCDDSNPAIHPDRDAGEGVGNPAECGNGVDEDCNGQLDCGEPACDGQRCPGGDGCTTGNFCKASTGMCGFGTPITCPGPSQCQLALYGGACTDGGCQYQVQAGADCDAGATVDAGHCTSLGDCLPGNFEALCGDGVDNDSNGLTDCADPACSLNLCDAGNLCAGAGHCVSSSCQAGPPTTCPAAPACTTSTGCAPATGTCGTQAAAAGTACLDGGVCKADGGCTRPEQGALCSNLLDDDDDGLTDCADPGCLAGVTCNDRNACTSMEACSAGTCGGGTSVLCTAPNAECYVMPVACAPDAGCAPVRFAPGTRCASDAGTCGDGGQCVADPIFKYPPSNFDPQAVAVPDAGLLINCAATIDTNSTNAQTACGQTIRLVRIPQTGTDDLALLAIPSLTVTSGGALRATGGRPLGIAVYGDATIAGVVDVSSRGDQTQGAGGDLVSLIMAAKPHCSTGRGDPGATVGFASGGGGGAGFGLAGALGGEGNGEANGSGDKSGKAAAGGANAVVELVPLRGGCQGGRGGASVFADQGGGGGGAVQLSVAGTLTVTGVIAAAGGGGSGGKHVSNPVSLEDCGGGGGGSGGAVLLEAFDLRLLRGAVTANGGSGGEGDGNGRMGGENGGPGNDGSPDSGVPAPGGDGPATTTGGLGGAGGVKGNAPDPGGASSGDGTCGGGGGGAVGVVRFNWHGSYTVDGGVLSPTATCNNTSNCP